MARRCSPRSAGMNRSNRQTFTGMALVAVSIVAAASLAIRKNESAAAPPPPAYVAQFDTVEVPVPEEPVAAGTKVKDIAFKMVAFPRHQLAEGALLSVLPYQEAVTLAALPASLPLFAANLSLTAHRSNPVIEQIPAGMRAITLHVDATSAVEGWAGSGTIVDVLLVEKDRTSVIAERVKVLSAERVVAPVEGAAAPQVPSTVTLLVTQEQALAISTAVPRGRIAFALRSLSDDQSWHDKSFSAERLHGRAAGKRSAAITGYAAVRTESGERRFALSDGSWVQSEVIPEGFLPARQE